MSAVRFLQINSLNAFFKIALRKSRAHSDIQVGVMYVYRAHSSLVSRQT